MPSFTTFDPQWIPSFHFLVRGSKKDVPRRRSHRCRRGRGRRAPKPLQKRYTKADRSALIGVVRAQRITEFSLAIEAEISRSLIFEVYDKTFWKAQSFHLSQKELNALQHALNGNIFSFLLVSLPGFILSTKLTYHQLSLVSVLLLCFDTFLIYGYDFGRVWVLSDLLTSFHDAVALRAILLPILWSLNNLMLNNNFSHAFISYITRSFYFINLLTLLFWYWIAAYLILTFLSLGLYSFGFINVIIMTFVLLFLVLALYFIIFDLFAAVSGIYRFNNSRYLLTLIGRFQRHVRRIQLHWVLKMPVQILQLLYYPFRVAELTSRLPLEVVLMILDPQPNHYVFGPLMLIRIFLSIWFIVLAAFGFFFVKLVFLIMVCLQFFYLLIFHQELLAMSAAFMSVNFQFQGIIAIREYISQQVMPVMAYLGEFLMVVPGEDGPELILVNDINTARIPIEYMKRWFLRHLTSVSVGGQITFVFLCFIATFYFVISKLMSGVKAVTLRLFERLLLILFIGSLPLIVPDFYILLFCNTLLNIRNYLIEVGFVRWVHQLMCMLNLSSMYFWSSIDVDDQQPPNNFAGGADFKNISSVFVQSWVNFTRKTVFKFVAALDNVKLPEYIQRSYKAPTLDSVRNTYRFLGEIGFPVDQTFIDSLERPEQSSYLAEWGSYKEWLLGTSNFSLGFRDVKVAPHSWATSLATSEFPGYIHSATFTGVAEEILSTARYFTGNHEIKEIDGFEETLEDLHHMVKAQYDASKLTSFEDIYRKWVKKFNMGFGFSDPRYKKLKQRTRQAVIDSMGGKKPFLKAWERIFYNSTNLLLPSPVFTKWESLKLKKALSRSVRTVVGSAFTHHVMTTVFNYAPNHNYAIWQTPMKVGMSITGQSYAKLWESLSPYQKVYAGDMTAFDSSIPPPIIKLIAELRKRGFSWHADHERICTLIDISYEMLRDQPLGFKNFGDIAWKGQGFTTGHSSTSSDNSLALVACLLYSWRKQTGLRAEQFANYNTLANFGDDFVLGYDEVFGWDPKRTPEDLIKIGITMRDEAPGQDSLPFEGMHLPDGVNHYKDLKFGFLGKKPLPITPEIRAELVNAGIDVNFKFATCHDEGRLRGKAGGQQLKSATVDPVKSYSALVSYMYLCAHHKEAYDVMAKNAMVYYKAHKTLFKEKKLEKALPPPPSYNQVLRVWYAVDKTPEGVSLLEHDGQIEGSEDEDLITIIENPDPLRTFVRWVSDFPSLLSPRYRNMRWADWLQSKLSSQLSWPLTFIAASNQRLHDLELARNIMGRTNYSFLRSPAIHIVDTNYTTLLVRHWLYNIAIRILAPKRGFSILDMVRILDHGYINVVWLFFGRIAEVTVELDLHILESLLIVLISRLELPDLGLKPIAFDLLAPSTIFSMALTAIFNFFSPGGSIDFQPWDERVRRLAIDPSSSFLLSAPTGIGKTTHVMYRLRNAIQRRVIVIVPRQIVAIGVHEYMNSIYPNSGIGLSVEGKTFADDDTIIYTTAQSFLGNARLRTPGSVLVLDEAHVEEPHYLILRSYLTQLQGHRMIWVTATPPHDCPLPVFNLPAINTKQIVDIKPTEVKSLNDYVNNVAAWINSRNSSERVLVFIPTYKLAVVLASKVRNTSTILSSKTPNYNKDAAIFISTSVSDAGLTIPDVGYVFSPDIDVKVRTIDTDRGEVSSPYFFRLSPQTIRQRRGRTGRTSNGVFFLYVILDQATEPVSYTFKDYANSLRPASALALQFIPSTLPRPFGDSTSEALRLLDNITSLTWAEAELVVGNAKMFRKNLTETINKILEKPLGFAMKAEALRPDQVLFTPGADDDADIGALVPLPLRNSESALPIENLSKKLWGDMLPPKPQAQKSRTIQANVTPKGWVNVSGSGLLCGARALAGAIGEATGYLPHEDVVIKRCRDALSDEQVRLTAAAMFMTVERWEESQQAFFPADTLDQVARYWWNVRLICTRVQGSKTDEIEFDPKYDDMQVGRIRLSGAHYNYWGVWQPLADPSALETYEINIFSHRLEKRILIPIPGFDFPYYFAEERSSDGQFSALGPIHEQQMRSLIEPHVGTNELQDILFGFYNPKDLRLPRRSNRIPLADMTIRERYHYLNNKLSALGPIWMLDPIRRSKLHMQWRQLDWNPDMFDILVM
nr:MAG: RNA-dependent RNA polymerase [Moss fusarivirus]